MCTTSQIHSFLGFSDHYDTVIHSFKAPWVGNCYWPDISIKSSFPEITSRVDMSTLGGRSQEQKKGSPMCPMFLVIDTPSLLVQF